MKKFPAKMSTEELAERLGMTRQTINRWIREQKWHTEPMAGIKGGRARLIFMTQDVLDYLANTPALRDEHRYPRMEEPMRSYSANENDVVWHQNIDILRNMTPVEQLRLNQLLLRIGLSGFLTRIGINEDENEA
ncbi:YfeC-like transcriptional regulator [Kluyvera intermedia]|uniref:YfeC-like transcriptional regulator n=1 Tax=Kluyvera intermedia TaxID=61648 RepID=UPI0039F4F758